MVILYCPQACTTAMATLSTQFSDTLPMLIVSLQQQRRTCRVGPLLHRHMRRGPLQVLPKALPIAPTHLHQHLVPEARLICRAGATTDSARCQSYAKKRAVPIDTSLIRSQPPLTGHITHLASRSCSVYPPWAPQGGTGPWEPSWLSNAPAGGRWWVRGCRQLGRLPGGQNSSKSGGISQIHRYISCVTLTQATFRARAVHPEDRRHRSRLLLPSISKSTSWSARILSDSGSIKGSE